MVSLRSNKGLPSLISSLTFKVALFEALVPAIDRHKTDGLFWQNGTNLGVYRFISLPLQEQEFHHDSLLKPVHLALTNVQVDFFMTLGH
jgi:hypothetical protein